MLKHAQYHVSFFGGIPEAQIVFEKLGRGRRIRYQIRYLQISGNFFLPDIWISEISAQL